jgi:hypothetical protein
VVIDNNGIDPIADIPGAYDAVLAGIDRGDLQILYVHTTLTEVADTPDKDRRDQLLLTLVNLGKPVPSHGFVLGESRLDHAALTDESGVADLEALASGNLDHENNRRDALVANTAKANGWAVVTNESRLRKRSTSLGVEVLSTEALLGEIGFVTA